MVFVKLPEAAVRVVRGKKIFGEIEIMLDEMLDSGSEFFTHHFINDLDRCFVGSFGCSQQVLNGHIFQPRNFVRWCYLLHSWREKS